LHGYEDVQGAYNAFLNEYRKVFHESTDEMYKPKTPTAVLSALMKFAEERSSDLVENEVVILDGQKMTEISGTVPVDTDRVMYYRMDSIMRRKADGKIFSWDHKSTSAYYMRSNKWSEQFHLGGVLGIEFCGAGFEYLIRGSAARPAGYHVTLQRVPAFKTPDQMNVWLWTVSDILDDIDRDMDRLFHCKEDDPVLMAFRMDPNSCTNYRGCPFHDFCLAWSNPLQQCYEPPLGFKVEFWDPSAMKTTVKKDLTWRS
jgi:hypothetical protein